MITSTIVSLSTGYILSYFTSTIQVLIAVTAYSHLC